METLSNTPLFFLAPVVCDTGWLDTLPFLRLVGTLLMIAAACTAVPVTPPFPVVTSRDPSTRGFHSRSVWFRSALGWCA